MICGYHISVENPAGYVVAVWTCAMMITLYIPRYCSTESSIDAAFAVLSFSGLFWFIILYLYRLRTAQLKSYDFKNNDTTITSACGKYLMHGMKLSEASILEASSCERAKICAKAMDLESQL